MTNVDVRALAKLARLEVSDEEVAKLETEIPAILKFVETIRKADASHCAVATDVRNVMREDAEPHESGKYTDALLAAAPCKKANRVVVKQVVSRKK
jgi:aspartyl/glutamyl-tRNA(Asn/Gln) amidotransferase C subunit